MNHCNASETLLAGLHSWLLNKHGFGLCRSTYTQNFLNKYLCCFPSVGGSQQMWGWLYAFVSAILCRDLEHLWILVSEGSSGITPQIPRDNLNFRVSEITGIFFTVWGSESLTHALFSGQLYILSHLIFTAIPQR